MPRVRVAEAFSRKGERPPEPGEYLRAAGLRTVRLERDAGASPIDATASGLASDW